MLLPGCSKVGWHYPFDKYPFKDKVLGCGRTYPMDKDLFNGSSYLTVKHN